MLLLQLGVPVSSTRNFCLAVCNEGISASVFVSLLVSELFLTDKSTTIASLSGILFSHIFWLFDFKFIYQRSNAFLHLRSVCHTPLGFISFLLVSLSQLRPCRGATDLDLLKPPCYLPTPTRLTKMSDICSGFLLTWVRIHSLVKCVDGGTKGGLWPPLTRFQHIDMLVCLLPQCWLTN